MPVTKSSAKPKPRTKPIEWKPERIKLKHLKPWDHNPRQSTDAQAERIERSRDRFGQMQTIAIGPNAEVYDGHQRLSAWMAKHGPEFEVWALRASRPLTESERKEAVVALHVGATGQWDADVLAGWDAKTFTDWGVDEDFLRQFESDRVMWMEMIRANEAVTDAQEFTEADGEDVEMLTCPHCGKTFPK